MRMPLEDVTVLDLSHALAGPFCSTMLADFGASVIKLEPAGSGDIARSWGPPLPGGAQDDRALTGPAEGRASARIAMTSSSVWPRVRASGVSAPSGVCSTKR